MTRFALKSAWLRKRRLAGTFLAVFLGVSFLSGTLVLGATLQSNFDELFADANAGTDALVRSATKVTGDNSFQRGPIPASTVERVRDVPGVESVAPYVEGYGQLLDKHGEPIGGNGPPRLAASWVKDPDLNAYRLAEGRAPRADGEVVINRGAAESGGLALGDTTTLEMPRPVRVRIVGIATFGSADGFGTATYTAMPPATAQRLILGRTDRLTSIRVEAAPGTSQEQLAARLGRVLPAGLQAITGAQLTQENSDDIGAEFLDGLRAFLLVFAAIALFVGAFSIYNTLSILAAQRTRESALMRALGASRRQLLRAQLTESLLIGAVASLAGLAGGVGIATALKAMFSAFGGALPDGGLVFNLGTAVISVAVGITVTALAGVLPARRASRIAPLAALRETAAETVAISRVRAWAGPALVAAGVLAVLLGAAGAGGMAVTGAGAALTLAGTVVCGPLVARPLGGLLGAPLARLRGMPGTLARDNTKRNPRRTAATAAALMVGVGMVSLFTVVAGSLKSSIEDSVARSFAGDLAVTTPAFGGGALDPRLAGRIAALPQVDGAVGLGMGAARLGGASHELTVADPTQLRRVVDLDVEAGRLESLGARGLAVSADMADQHGWQVGSQVPVTFADGARETYRVGAVYADSRIARDVLIGRDGWRPHAVQDLDRVIFLTLARGVDPASAGAAVVRVMRTGAAGDAEVQDRQEYVDASAGGINALLGVVYVLLLLAIAIALMGIANTLSLSIHERTRELGLLRAVGATRRQVRAVVRGESLIIAVFGTLGGLALGIFLGWGFVRSAGSSTLYEFAVPSGQLAAGLIAGAFAGVLASLRPARRAARLDVLRAIAT